MPQMRTHHRDPSAGPNISRGETVPLEDAEGQAYPDIRPGSKFLLYWTPGIGCFCVRQMSDGTPVLVPRVQIMRGAPGVGGVDGGDGKPLDFSKPTAAARRRGGVVLDAATMRERGLPSYLQRHKLARQDSKGNDTYLYLPPWRFPRRTRSGAWTVDCDEDAKTKWEQALLASGVIPRPDPEDLMDLLSRRARRVARHMNEATQRDAVAHAAEKADYAAEMRAIEAAGFVLDDLDGTVRYQAPESVELPVVEDADV